MTMDSESSTDKLARYVIYVAVASVICALCWYFKSIIVYILIAAVVSLIGHPIIGLLKKIKIKKRSAPDWLLSIITIIIIVGLFFLIIGNFVPIIRNIVKDLSVANLTSSAGLSQHPVAALDDYLVSTFPGLGPDFRIETAIAAKLKEFVNFTSVSSVIGSVASALTGFGVALFSIVFISFFFIKDENLFTDMIASLVPDRHEKKMREAINDVSHLLSRYFVGLSIEILGVGLLNFLGLAFIARIGYDNAAGIALLTGILNIIPYVGPLTGGVIGTVLGLILKYSSSLAIMPGTNFWLFTCILAAIFCVTQLVDNFVYQPVIYSTSIKAHPLEIFIVLLVAGNVGGVIGMLVAIPGYTVIRVIAFRFFGNVKAIRRLMPPEEEEKNRINLI